MLTSLTKYFMFYYALLNAIAVNSPLSINILK